MIDLDGIDLNGYESGTSDFLIDPEEGFEFGAGPLEVKWIERHVGAVPLANPRLSAMETEVPIICVGDDDDAILASIGTLGEKRTAIQHSARSGGTEIGWQKLGATYPSTLDCFAIEIGPVAISVDDQRLRVGRFKLKLICGPFVLGPEYTAASGTKPAGIPVADIVIPDVKGDVPGPCKVEVTNQGTTAQQHVRMGLQWRDCVTANDCLLPASTFDVSTSPLNGTYTAGTNEVQTLTKSGTLSGGTYTLTWEGQTTSALANTANAATVQAALEALSTVGAGDWVVTGGPISAANLVFTAGAELVARNLSQISITSSLTGGGTATMSTTTAGVDGYVYTAVYSEWSAFMRTAAQTDTGSYDIWARVYDAGSVANQVLVRAKVAVGDVSVGTTNKSVAVPACAVPIWVNLGPAHADPLPTGSHRWTVTVEAKTLGTVGTSFRVLDIEKRPTPMGQAIVRTPSDSSQTLKLSDDFNQTAGSYTGKSMDLGGTVSGGGDADDFSIDTTNDVLQRTAVSDAANTGRYVYAGSSMTDCAAEVTVTTSTASASSKLGILIRRYDANNYAFATITYAGLIGGVIAYYDLTLWKRVAAGTPTAVGTLPYAVAGAERTISVEVRSSGAWKLTGSNVTTVASGTDTDFATGGAMPSGTAGIYDEWTSASASTRTYNTFRAYALPAIDAAIHPSQTLEWGYDGNLTREASAGTYYAYAAGQQGVGVPMLGPEGSEGLSNRLVLASDDLNPDFAASGAQVPRLDYVVTARPAYAIGRHTA